MITLNLLPDIKKEYLRAQRKKRLIVVASFMVTIASIAAVVLVSIYVFGIQKLQIYNSQNTIDSSIKTLKESPDLAKTVTIQNQLKALPVLHDGKTAVKRLPGFLKILTPNDVSISSIVFDLRDNTAEIKGSGKNFKAVNTFVDTLKNASYTYAENDEKTPAFSNVVLLAIGKDRKEAGYKITLSYDPLIFDNTVKNLKLDVPNITSTRSSTEKPHSLFDTKTDEKTDEGKEQ